MKNKKFLYILVPATVIIWGLIIYKIISYINTEPKINPVISKSSGDAYDNFSQTDTFLISMDYSDPFLKNITPKAKLVSNNIPETQKTPDTRRNKRSQKVGKKKELSIKYKGFIHSNSENIKKVILQIEGRTYFIEKEIEEFDIKIIEIWSDSISILSKNKSLIIKK